MIVVVFYLNLGTSFFIQCSWMQSIFCAMIYFFHLLFHKMVSGYISVNFGSVLVLYYSFVIFVDNYADAICLLSSVSELESPILLLH